MDTTAATLMLSTLTTIHQFNEFPVFPSDRSKADKLILIEATTVLNYVSTNLSSPPGGHGKRKRNMQKPVDDTPSR